MKRLDKIIREKIRTWLRLPKDTPLAYFYAKPEDGGLGVTFLVQTVPVPGKRRYHKLDAEEDPAVTVDDNTSSGPAVNER